jgi:hypothetical protein
MASQNEMSEAEVDDSTMDEENGLGTIEFGVNEM